MCTGMFGGIWGNGWGRACELAQKMPFVDSLEVGWHGLMNTLKKSGSYFLRQTKNGLIYRWYNFFPKIPILILFTNHPARYEIPRFAFIVVCIAWNQL